MNISILHHFLDLAACTNTWTLMFALFIAFVILFCLFCYCACPGAESVSGDSCHCLANSLTLRSLSWWLYEAKLHEPSGVVEVVKFQYRKDSHQYLGNQQLVLTLCLWEALDGRWYASVMEKAVGLLREVTSHCKMRSVYIVQWCHSSRNCSYFTMSYINLQPKWYMRYSNKGTSLDDYILFTILQVEAGRCIHCEL